jgi:hypothetical protein
MKITVNGREIPCARCGLDIVVTVAPEGESMGSIKIDIEGGPLTVRAFPEPAALTVTHEHGLTLQGPDRLPDGFHVASADVLPN